MAKEPMVAAIPAKLGVKPVGFYPLAETNPMEPIQDERWLDGEGITAEEERVREMKSQKMNQKMIFFPRECKTPNTTPPVFPFFI